MASLYIFLNTNLENISDFSLMVWDVTRYCRESELSEKGSPLITLELAVKARSRCD